MSESTTESIVQISNSAETQLIKIIQHELEQKKDLDQTKFGVRLKVVGGGCSGLSYKMDFDQITENDYVIEIDRYKVLVDPKSAIYLKDVILDFKDGLQGKGFVFNNPNASNTCGCGESFSI
jgi:iron-sulfur cluster assembly protein